MYARLGYKDWSVQRTWGLMGSGMLGTGSFASVHQGTNIITGQMVAIKVRSTGFLQCILSSLAWS